MEAPDTEKFTQAGVGMIKRLTGKDKKDRGSRRLEQHTWAEAVKSHRSGDWEKATSQFHHLCGARGNAKHDFSYAMALRLHRKHADAVRLLTRAQRLAPSLAVVPFMLGVCHWETHRYAESVLAFTAVLHLLAHAGGASQISYHKMGLPFVLVRREVQFNRAMGFLSLGLYHRARDDLLQCNPHHMASGSSPEYPSLHARLLYAVTSMLRTTRCTNLFLSSPIPKPSIEAWSGMPRRPALPRTALHPRRTHARPMYSSATDPHTPSKLDDGVAHLRGILKDQKKCSLFQFFLAKRRISPLFVQFIMDARDFREFAARTSADEATTRTKFHKIVHRYFAPDMPPNALTAAMPERFVRTKLEQSGGHRVETPETMHSVLANVEAFCMEYLATNHLVAYLESPHFLHMLGDDDTQQTSGGGGGGDAAATHGAPSMAKEDTTASSHHEPRWRVVATGLAPRMAAKMPSTGATPPAAAAAAAAAHPAHKPHQWGARNAAAATRGSGRRGAHTPSPGRTRAMRGGPRPPAPARSLPRVPQQHVEDEVEEETVSHSPNHGHTASLQRQTPSDEHMDTLKRRALESLLISQVEEELQFFLPSEAPDEPTSIPMTGSIGPQTSMEPPAPPTSITMPPPPPPAEVGGGGGSLDGCVGMGGASGGPPTPASPSPRPRRNICDEAGLSRYERLARLARKIEPPSAAHTLANGDDDDDEEEEEGSSSTRAPRSKRGESVYWEVDCYEGTYEVFVVDSEEDYTDEDEDDGADEATASTASTHSPRLGIPRVAGTGKKLPPLPPSSSATPSTTPTTTPTTAASKKEQRLRLQNENWERLHHPRSPVGGAGHPRARRGTAPPRPAAESGAGPPRSAHVPRGASHAPAPPRRTPRAIPRAASLQGGGAPPRPSRPPRLHAHRSAMATSPHHEAGRTRAASSAHAIIGGGDPAALPRGAGHQGGGARLHHHRHHRQHVLHAQQHHAAVDEFLHRLTNRPSYKELRMSGVLPGGVIAHSLEAEQDMSARILSAYVPGRAPPKPPTHTRPRGGAW